MGKKSKKTTTETIYKNTTTTNPFVTSSSSNSGTTSSFVDGTAFDTVYNFVNDNMGKMLDSYLNPTLNSVTNQAKLNSYTNTLNTESAKALENNIINPLSKRNMIRSSQATNMYNNLAQTNASQLASYAQELLAGSQKDTAAMLANLMLWYMNGYDVLSDTQKQSLAASQGSATNTNTSGDSSSSLMQLATQMAMMAAGL